MLFDHCAECKRCCVVDPGYPPLEVSLTRSEEKRFGSICIERKCPHLGKNGCRLGHKKPFSCSLYPLSFNPKQRTFSIDRDCPLADTYVKQLKDVNSDASIHLREMKQTILEMEKSERVFLRDNYAVDVDYFDLKKLPIRRSLAD